MNKQIPGREETVQTLQEILTEFEQFTPPEYDESIGRSSILDRKPSPGLSGITWILIIAGIIIFFGFLILRLSKSVRKEEEFETEDLDIFNEDLTADMSVNELYSYAEDAASEGNYAVAVVFLYRASIAFMIQKGILLIDIGATNREIKRNINTNKSHLKSFILLAHFSEHVLFNEEQLSEQDYERAKNSYSIGFTS